MSTLAEDNCDLAILPFEVSDAPFAQVKYSEEHLSITVKKDHPLSEKSEVTFSDINGYNFLLRSDIGFWEKLCRDKMPSSKFLVQNNDSDLEELINNSTLPGFMTDLASSHAILSGNRIVIPITDAEANVTYYIASKHPEKFGIIFIS
ncbi:MAG: LysR substrate-binding domain-containing protein [Anaerovoracaceae bacterium]